MKGCSGEPDSTPTHRHTQASINQHTHIHRYIYTTMEDTYSDPIKATSNQNASPCSIPLVQSSNLTGIAILLCEIIIHYVEEKPPPTLIPTPSPAPMFCKQSQTGTREGMGTRLIFSVSLHSLSGYTERESLKCFQVTTCVNPIPQLS